MNKTKKLKIGIPKDVPSKTSLEAPRPLSELPELHNNWSNSSHSSMDDERTNRFHEVLIGNTNSIHNPQVESYMEHDARTIVKQELTDDIFPEEEYDEFKRDIGKMAFMEPVPAIVPPNKELTQAFLMNMNLYHRAKYLEAEKIIDIGGENNIYYKQYLGLYAKIRPLVPAMLFPSLKEITINTMLNMDVTYLYHIVGILPGEARTNSSTGLEICGYPVVSITSYYDVAPVPDGIFQFAEDREPVRRFRACYKNAAKALVLLYRRATGQNGEVPWYFVHKLVMVATGIAERYMIRNIQDVTESKQAFLKDASDGYKTLGVSNGSDVYVNPVVLREQIAKAMLKYS